MQSFSPLIGRTQEFAFLNDRANLARQGKGGLVFLKGEAGVGKTSLLKELGARQEPAGTIFLQGRCYSPTIPYSPWIEAVSDCCKKTDPQKLKLLLRGPMAEITALVPSLGDLAKGEARGVGLRDWLKGPGPAPAEGPLSALADSVEDKSGRIAFLEGITQFFTSVSARTPLIISLEDLHQADKISLILLRYITRHIFDNRILLVGSFREEELDPSHPLSRLVLELEKEALCQTVKLEPLPRDSVQQIVTSFVSDTPMSKKIADIVYTATRGNPYFVSETLRSLQEQGVIGGKFVDEAKLKGTLLPSNVKSLMRQRLERLDPECLELLEIGSLMVPSLDHELLSAVSNMPEEKMLAHLETALKNGLLHETKAGSLYRLDFTDPRIRSLLQQDLSAIRRRKLHEKIAEAMEKRYSKNLTEFLDELAYQYVESGNVEKATHYSMLAGEQATQTHAYDEAIKHYQNVVELAEQGSEAAEAEKRIRALRASIESWNQSLQLAAEKLTLEGYSRVSERYEANYVPRFEPLARKVVANARLKKGERVLDLGTGTGLAAFLASEAVGPTGYVLGIDLSEGMLAMARAKKEKNNRANVDFLKMDETSLEVPDSSFDAVISDLGLSRFNADKGFKEMHRVLKPGGVVSFNEWTDKRSQSSTLMDEVLGRHRTKSPSELLVGMREARTSMFQFYERVTDRRVLEKMMRDTGFREVHSSTETHPQVFSSVEEIVKLLGSSSWAPLEFDEMAPEEKKALMIDATETLEPLFSPTGLVSEWELNFITARK